MARSFDNNLVNREYYVPKPLLYKLMLKQFVKNPILCSYIYAVNLCCKYKGRKAIDLIKAKWPLAVSTKNLNE
jgi:hypothetical protein